MAGVITVNRDLATDTTDILGGTALDPVPGPGVLMVFLASSQRDGIFTCGGPAVLGGAYRVPPVLRSSGIPDLSADMPYILPVQQGKAILDYDEVTAGDAFVTIMYLPG